MEAHDDTTLAEGAEAALREAAANLSEQVAALSEAIDYHEARARELKATRTRVVRVQAIVDGTEKRGRPSSNGSAGREAARAVHSAQRDAKRDRLRAVVESWDPGEDFTSDAAEDALRADGGPPVSRGLIYDLLRDLRDEGTLRLDRIGNGQQSIYRRVASRE